MGAGFVTLERDKMLAGELYDPYDPGLVLDRGRARDLCRALDATPDDDTEFRRILAELFGSGGGTVLLEPPFFCDYGSNIRLGEGCHFHAQCVVLDACPVTIGDFTLIGPAVQIYTALHPMDPVLRRTGQEWARPVEIGSGVRIGGRAILCPGVRVGSRSTIQAGSVVTRDIPEGVIAAGNPCRVIGEVTG